MDDVSENEFWSGPQEVKLPSSGLRVALCRPSRLYWDSLYSRFPEDLAEKWRFLGLSGEKGNWTREEVERIVDVLQDVIQESFNQAWPGPLTSPQDAPHLRLDERDTVFVMRYLCPELGSEASQDVSGAASRALAGPGRELWVS